MSAEKPERPIVVRGTEINPGDPVRLRMQKLARITLDSMVQFVGLLDAQGTVLEINKVALDAVGIKLSDVEGKPFWKTFWWQVSEEINATLRASIQPRLARRIRSLGYADLRACRWQRDDHHRRLALPGHGRRCGVVVFIQAEGRDISAKKAQEQEIAQKNIELQGLLRTHSRARRDQDAVFCQRQPRACTPLTLILGPAQRMIDDNGTMDLSTRQEAAQVITRNARMLLKHVNDLLDMSKLEAGKLKIELQETDIAALLRLLASYFSVLAEERRIHYVVDAGEQCIFAVDGDKLQRVIMNLLANAFKFVPDGGQVRRAPSASRLANLPCLWRILGRA